MKYYKYDIRTRHSDTESSETYLEKLDDDIDLEAKAHELAAGYYGDKDDEYSEHMKGYWWPNGEGVTFIPDLIEISKSDYQVLQKHL